MLKPPYMVFEIQPEWVLEPEALGSKEKFWYRADSNGPEWLFKYPQKNTGQHWAEKVAAEIAQSLGIFHARVELATFQGARGSSSESFARHGRSLFHGNQILAGQVLGYDPKKKFQQCDHTLDNIFVAIDKAFVTEESAHKAKIMFADYLVMDALIGNTDRHHENQGILVRHVGDHWEGILAPTFDHASSLGRELMDEAEGTCRERLLRGGRIGQYAEKARGAVFWDSSDRRALSPLNLVRRAAVAYPELLEPPLGRLGRLEREVIDSIVQAIPVDWMTPLARQFAVELMIYNCRKLREI